MAVLPNADGSNFVQRDQILNLEGPVNQFVQNAYEFSDNLADIIEDISRFLDIASVFLKAIKSPLELILLPVIDSLQSYINELKNIGAGILTVYPWEVGTVPEPVNFSQLLIAFKKFEEYLKSKSTDESIEESLRTDESIEESLRIEENFEVPLGTGIDFNEVTNVQTANSVLNQIVSGVNTASVTDAISDLAGVTLPSEYKAGISGFEIEMGVEKPFGISSSIRSGTSRLIDSKSFIQQPAQSSSQLRENVLESYQSLKNFLDLDSSTWADSLIGEALGYLSTFLNKRELTPKEAIDHIIKSFDDSNDSNRPTGTGEYSSLVILATLPSFSGVNKVINSLANFLAGIFEILTPEDGKVISDKEEQTQTINLGSPVQLRNKTDQVSRYWFNDVKIKKVKDGTYKITDEPVTIPMFKKGDKIVQTNEGLFQKSFSATVVKHNPIIIVNNEVISNTVQVKNVDGELLLNHSTRDSSNPGTIRKNINDGDILMSPMFLPGDSDQTSIKPVGSAAGTVTSSNLALEEVFPNDPRVRKFAKLAQNGEDIYNRPDLYDEDFVFLMNEFVKNKLVPGMQVNHPFLGSDELESTVDTEDLKKDNSAFNWQSLKKLIPGMGTNLHIKEVNIIDDKGNSTNVADNRGNVELFRYSVPERKSKEKVDRQIIGMNKIQVKLGRMIADKSIDDSSSLLDNAVKVPNGKTDWFDFFNTKEDGTSNVFFDLFSEQDSSIPPNWNYFTIAEFLPVYGRLIDRIYGLTSTVRGWIEEPLGLIDEALNFIEDFIKWLNDTNKLILDALTVLTQGLNANGLYTLSLSGFGGVNEFKTKLVNAKFLQKKANPFPSMEIETVKVNSTVINPITGIEETVTTETLKPVLVPADKSSDTPTVLSAQDLDDLKYTIAIVFYASGTDSKGFNKFVNNFKLAQDFSTNFARSLVEGSPLESLIEQLLGEGDSRTISDKIKPYVYDIRVQNTNNEFVDAESAIIPGNSKIRVIFANDSHLFSSDEIEIINKIQGRTINMSPTVLTSAFKLSQEDVDNGKSEFTLTQGTNSFLLKNPPSVSTTFENGREFFNVDFTPVDTLSATEPGDSNYIFSAVKNPVYSIEKMKVDSDRGMTLKRGFKILQTTVLDVEIK